MNTYEDKRGKIDDLLVGEKGAVTHITFKKGVVRGNHFHKKTVQYDFLLSGSLLCKTPEKTFIVTEGSMVGHPANVPHAYLALEDSEMVSCVYGVRVGTQYEQDTFRLKEPLL